MNSIKGLILLIFFASLVIGISARGLINCNKAIDCKLDKDKKEMILMHQTLFQFCLGFGSGLIVYAILSRIIGVSTIILPAIIICVMSGINITAYQNLSDDENCNKDKIRKANTLMYGFIGAGIGMLLSAGLILALSKLNIFDYRSIRILAIFLCIIKISLCSIDIHTVNNTPKECPTSKTVSIIFLSLAVLSLCGLLISFKFLP